MAEVVKKVKLGKKERAALKAQREAEANGEVVVEETVTAAPKEDAVVQAEAQPEVTKKRKWEETGPLAWDGQNARKKYREVSAMDEAGREQARRDAQKALQKEVLKMMKEGKSKAEITKFKKNFQYNNNFRTPKEKEDPVQAKKDYEERRKTLGSQHEVVIIPVCWKKHAEEKIEIEAACERLKKRLMAKGVDTWCDWRTLYTPGQKLAYWEHLGVLRRIELGPKDLEQKSCVISRCVKAGVPPEKKSVSLNGAAILKALRKWDLEKIEVTEEDCDYEEGQELEQHKVMTGDGDEENFVLKSDAQEAKKKKTKPTYKKRK